MMSRIVPAMASSRDFHPEGVVERGVEALEQLLEVFDFAGEDFVFGGLGDNVVVADDEVGIDDRLVLVGILRGVSVEEAGFGRFDVAVVKGRQVDEGEVGVVAEAGSVEVGPFGVDVVTEVVAIIDGVKEFVVKDLARPVVRVLQHAGIENKRAEQPQAEFRQSSQAALGTGEILAQDDALQAARANHIFAVEGELIAQQARELILLVGGGGIEADAVFMNRCVGDELEAVFVAEGSERGVFGHRHGVHQADHALQQVLGDEVELGEWGGHGGRFPDVPAGNYSGGTPCASNFSDASKPSPVGFRSFE